MTARPEDMADRFEQANQRLIALVEPLAEAEWRRTLDGEGWPIGVALHHVAVAHPLVLGWVRAVVAGHGLPHATWADFNAGNAAHARQHADPPKRDTLDALRTASADAAAYLRTLADDQLDEAAPAHWWGNVPLSAQQIVEIHMTGHAAGHARSIRAALGV